MLPTILPYPTLDVVRTSHDSPDLPSVGGPPAFRDLDGHQWSSIYMDMSAIPEQ